MGPTGLMIGNQALKLFGGYSKWKGERENAKRQAEALSRQAGAAAKQMNYAFQNYELQRMDAFDATVNNLMKVGVSSMGLLSAVRGAVNEETGGDSRTGRALVRSANADLLRTITSIKDNYERQSDEISLNKEAYRNQTADIIANIKAQAPEMPSTRSLILGFIGQGISSYGQYLGTQSDMSSILGSGYRGASDTNRFRYNSSPWRSEIPSVYGGGQTYSPTYSIPFRVPNSIPTVWGGGMRRNGW